jgi:glycerol-3-phosphate dehydrogenase (NAD(P)+)
MRKAAVIGAGEMGTAMAAVLGRAGMEVQLACRTAAQAERIAAAGRNPDVLQHVGLPKSVTPCTVADVEPAGLDLVVLATPLAGLPAVVQRMGDAIGPRSTVLLPVRGELGAHAAPVVRHLRERTGAAAVACLAVPGGASAIVAPPASVDISCSDPDRARQLADALERAGVELGSAGAVRPAERPAA